MRKIKKAKWLVVLMVVAMLVSLGPAMVVAVNDNDDCVTLYAGQDIPVGTVCVSNDGEYLYVTYCIDDEYWEDGEGWGLYETHVHVGEDLADFPLNRGGNPQIGHFAYKAYHEGVQCYEEVIPLGDWEAEDELLIAAHAVIELPEISYTDPRDVCIFSGVDTKILSDELEEDYTDAVHTWEPSAWNQQLQETLADEAIWVWESYYVANPRNGDLVEFYEFFELEGTLVSAELKIAADNAFEVNINDGEFVATENLEGEWRGQSVFTTEYLPDPSPSGWSIVYTYDVLGALVTGDNTMNVTGVNAAWGTDDPEVNPAGVRYQLCIEYEVEVIEREADEETAWGAGTRFVEQGNWATYFNYTVEEYLELVDEFTVDSADPDGTDSSIALVVGANYRIKVGGTWSNKPSNLHEVDAKYISFDNWDTYEEGYPDRDTTLLELMVDGEFVDWGEFSPDHIYYWHIEGEGDEVNLAVYDTYYGDNVGSFDVEIYRVW